MLQLLKNNSPYTVIMLLIFTLLAKMQVLVHPVFVMPDNDGGLYHLVVSVLHTLLRGSAFGYTFLAVGMLFAQSLYLNAMVIRHRMFHRPNYIPAFLYLLLTSLHPSFSYFSDALLMNWLLLGGLDIALTFHNTTKPRKHVFNAGFLLAVAALLHFPALVLILLLFAALILLRSFQPGEWLVAVLGYLTPAYFWLGILFLLDRLDGIKMWPKYGFFLPKTVPQPLHLAGVLTGIVILTMAGLYMMQRYIARTGVFARRNWVLVVVSIFITLMVGIFTPPAHTMIWLLPMIPLSMVIAHSMYAEKNKRFSNFAFYFSLLLVIFCQVALK